MCCNDPSLALLKKYGYHVFRLPRASAAPLEIFCRIGGELMRLGHLVDVFDMNGIVPPVTAGAPAVSISRTVTSQFDAGLGLSLLDALIGALGGRLGVKAHYGDARKIAFTYQDVFEEFTTTTRLDAFLTGARVRDDLKLVGRILDADAMYITTSVLKSNRFLVEALDGSETALPLNPKAIQRGIGPEIAVSPGPIRPTQLLYQGKIPLGFAFRAVRLIYEGEHYARFQVTKPGSSPARMENGGFPADSELFSTDAELVRIATS